MLIPYPSGTQTSRYKRSLIRLLLILPSSFASSIVLANNAATVYQHCNYGGYKASLPAGSYNLAKLRQYGVRNDDLSSLRIQSGYKAIFFEHDNFRGRSWTLASNSACFTQQRLNDVASSVRIVSTARKPTSSPTQSTSSTNQNGVTVYQHCSFGGYGVGLGAGNHDMRKLQQLGVKNDDISSLRVAPGFKAIVYEHDGYQGRNQTFTSSDECLVNNGFNDKTSSIQVVKANSSGTSPSTNIPVSALGKNLPVNLGSCRANLYSEQGWNKRADGSYAPNSRDLKLKPQGVKEAIPMRVLPNTSVHTDLSNLRLDASLLPLPKNGIFKDLQPKSGEIYGPVSAGIALGKQITAKADNHPLAANNSYLYFQLDVPLSFDLKNQSNTSNKPRKQSKTGEKSVGLSNLIFALDACDPSVSMGGVSVTINGVTVGLDAIALSNNGNLSTQSQNRVWSGGTRANGQPDLIKQTQTGHFYQKGSVGIGFGKFLGLIGSVKSTYDLDPMKNGALGVTQAMELLQGGQPSPLDYKLMLEGQLSLELAGLAEMPLQDALVSIDASDPYRTKLKISGKHGPALSLADFFPGDPPPGTELIKASGNIQLYVNADFNSLSSRPNGTYQGKLRGAFTVGPAKVKGDVDLTFRENRAPEVCVKLPAVNRVCGKEIENFVAKSAREAAQVADNTAQEVARFYQSATKSLDSSLNDAVNVLGNVASDASRNFVSPTQNKQDTRQLAKTAANNLRSRTLQSVNNLHRTIQPRLRQLPPSERTSYAMNQLRPLTNIMTNTSNSIRNKGASKVSGWSINPYFGDQYANVYRRTYDRQLGTLENDMQQRMQQLLR